MKENKIKLICIGGSTASGKTEASLILAKKYGGAIISCDSRQIYKELDLATDKIPYTLPYQDPIIFRGIDHYGINIAEIDKPFTLYDWMLYCHGAIEKIVKSGKIPLLVGGTGLYIQSIIENYDLKKDYDPKLRDQLNKLSLPQLQKKLQDLNPDLFNAIDTKNPRRVIRAIEKINYELRITNYENNNCHPENGREEQVVHYSGSPLNEIVLEKEIPNFDSSSRHFVGTANLVQDDMNVYENIVLAFDTPRDDIRKKILERVKIHQKKGVIDEVKRLVEKYGENNEILNSTISVQEYIPLVLGKISIEEAQERVAINNYHYAKRQDTWFKKYGNTIWCHNVQEMDEYIRKFLLIN